MPKLKTEEEVKISWSEYHDRTVHYCSVGHDQMMMDFLLATIHERDAAIREMIEQRIASAPRDEHCENAIHLVDLYAIISSLPVEKLNKQDE